MSLVFVASPSFAATYKTANFVVYAANTAIARKIGDAAERDREELGMAWLGQVLPRWSKPCEITVKSGIEVPAGGETIFTFSGGEVYDWKMRVQGSEERILDSVLPHEITHTIVASYLRTPVPRWLDEGMATSVESNAERSRYRSMLVNFLHTQRGIAFNDMVSMKEYPNDLTPFYSQSFSVCEYLILVGGQRRLAEFAKFGCESKDWDAALKKYYDCKSLGALQTEWNEWLRQWDLANCPAELPETRKMRDFTDLEREETALAHNERLVPPVAAQDTRIASTEREPRTRLWDNVRNLGRPRDEQTNVLARGQDEKIAQTNEVYGANVGKTTRTPSTRVPQSIQNGRREFVASNVSNNMPANRLANGAGTAVRPNSQKNYNASVPRSIY